MIYEQVGINQAVGNRGYKTLGIIINAHITCLAIFVSI